MNSVYPFVRLDFYTIKPYGKSMLLMLVLAVLMTALFKSLSTLCLYMMMCLIMIIVYPFSVGETNRLDTLYATLASSRRSVVVGRYVFAVCMEALAVLLAVGMSWGASLFTELAFVTDEIAFSLSVASFLFTLIASIQFPIYFKLGYNKAKLVAYMPMLLVFLGAVLIQNWTQGAAEAQFEVFNQAFEANKLLSCAVPVLVGHAVLALSGALSCRIYGKRDI